MSMKCISAQELEDKQLLAYLDHEADQETMHHLEQCVYCLERANALARFHDHLTDKLYRVRCPSSLELGEYHLRILSASQMMLISRHLRNCPHCTREINQLEEFLSDLAPTSEGNLIEQTKLLIAHLISGQGVSTAAGEPSFALRGDYKSPITYEADDIIIVLDIQRVNGGKVDILGQVAADDQDLWTDSIVTLKQADASKTTVCLDNLGAFRFEQVSSGSIQIIISSPHSVVVQIPSIDV